MFKNSVMCWVFCRPAAQEMESSEQEVVVPLKHMLSQIHNAQMRVSLSSLLILVFSSSLSSSHRSARGGFEREHVFNICSFLLLFFSGLVEPHPGRGVIWEKVEC